MSALPNPLHTQKKAPGQAARPAKLNKYGRDPKSPGERTRESSDYDTEKGYAPFFHAFLADWPRLSSGETSCLLFQVVLCKSLGRSVKKGEPRAVKTLPLAVSDLAALCRRDERSIQRELAGWQARKVAKVTTEGKGMVSVELLYRGWEALPDYKNVVSIETGEPVEDDTTVEDEKAKATRIELTKAPVPCKAGGRSKGVKINCGIKSFHLVNPSAVEYEITAMVQAGDLVITTRATDEWNRKQIAVSNGINNLDSTPRHPRGTVPANGGIGVPAKDHTVDHPRAAELVKLFDPILAASASRLLSGDSASLKAACEAVADCDHDFLVKFAIQRAERPVKSPLHVKTICAEALASWKASKVLTGAGLPAAGKKQGFAESVKAEARRRFEKYGTI
jgi:hypothetical protein